MWCGGCLGWIPPVFSVSVAQASSEHTHTRVTACGHGGTIPEWQKRRAAEKVQKPVEERCYSGLLVALCLYLARDEHMCAKGD